MKLRWRLTLSTVALVAPLLLFLFTHDLYVFLHYRSQRPCGLCVGSDTGIYIDSFFDLGPCGEVEIGDYCTIAGAIIATNNRVTIGNFTLFALHLRK